MSGTSWNHTKKTSALNQEETCTPGAASEERKESEDDRHDRQLRIPDAVSERRAIQDSYTQTKAGKGPTHVRDLVFGTLSLSHPKQCSTVL